ncbi:MAG: energy transducer TonB [Candidatus Azobacteroides sp.]|nr:energy transducer TonB [Candidatus Azobacteroides sp.]
MTRAIDLNSKEWRDLIFAGKNQLYGAYDIRKTSAQRHLMSLGIIVFMGIAFATLPTVMNKFFPKDLTLRSDSSKGEIIMSEYNPPEKNKPIETVKQATPAPTLPMPTIKFPTPKIVPDSEAPEVNEIPTQGTLSDTNARISDTTNPGVEGGTADPVDINKGNATETETTFTHVEQMPYFPGGEKELMSYLGRNIKYPVVAQEIGVQGTVTLRFVVDKDGNIKDVTVLRSLDPSCDKEAIRVVKSMPTWTPGRQNGVPVAVYYTIPVRFKLNS